MAVWLRATLLLIVIVVWATYVLVQLVRAGTVDPLVWGVPGGLFLLLGPTLRNGKNGSG